MTAPIPPIGKSTPTGPVLPEAFDQFVGDTFFRQMLKSMRSTAGKPAFLHGGQAEEIFQSQLDEVLITDMAKATHDSFSGELFKQQFKNHDPFNQPNSAPTESNPDQTNKPPMPPNQSNPNAPKFDANA